MVLLSEPALVMDTGTRYAAPEVPPEPPVRRPIDRAVAPAAPYSR